MRKKTYIFLLSVMLLIGFLPMVPALAGNSNEILIVRDNYGVPHIFANTKEGLGFGAGYAMAQDRLWQADLFRRDAFGSLAEFGFASIDSDYNTRAQGYSKEELLEMFNNWVPSKPEAKLKEMLLAYVDGINQYIFEALAAAAGGDLSLIPIEYLLLDLSIEPFTIEDCAAIVVMMAWRFGGTGGGELGYAARFQALNATYDEETAWAIFNDQYPQVDPGAPTTIPSQGSHYPQGPIQSSIPTLPDNINEIYEQVIGTTQAQEQLSESLGLPTKFGSNAWMVRPKKSETGNAMQVGGPQMGQTIPQIVHELGLHGAGINAVGMSMPVGPFVMIGASDFGAWTSTTGSSDLMDTYIEELNPENPYQYWYNGEWVDMENRTETFYGYKKNPLLTEERDIYRTVHGPIRAWDLDNNLCYSRKADYFKDEFAAEEGWMLFQQARSISDFIDATKVVTAGHNFFWVDRRGNIAYVHCGAFPKKPTTGKDGRIIDDRFPLWGTGEEEWLGVTGFDEIPKSINPAQGYLANWNNKPIADWPYREADWGEVHGVPWIQEQLAADKKISFEEMNDINRNTGYGHFGGMYFREFLINAAKKDPSIPTEVIDALEAWNDLYNDMIGPDGTYDDPGLTIFDAWFSKIDNEVFDDDLPYIGTPPYLSRVGGSPSTLLHVFDGEDSKLPLIEDYLNGEDRDVLIVRVLKNALAELETQYGPDVATWLTPVRTTKFDPQGFLSNPLFGQSELRMHSMNRGTYNQIVEMPKWKWKNLFKQEPPHAVNVIPPGQSGFFSMVTGPSPHAYDQLALYETWTYKPMLFRYQSIAAVAGSFTILSF